MIDLQASPPHHILFLYLAYDDSCDLEPQPAHITTRSVLIASPPCSLGRLLSSSLVSVPSASASLGISHFGEPHCGVERGLGLLKAVVVGQTLQSDFTSTRRSRWASESGRTPCTVRASAPPRQGDAAWAWVDPVDVPSGFGASAGVGCHRTMAGSSVAPHVVGSGGLVFGVVFPVLVDPGGELTAELFGGHRLEEVVELFAVVDLDPAQQQD